jgi:dienelactone hydrolase
MAALLPIRYFAARSRLRRLLLAGSALGLIAGATAASGSDGAVSTLYGGYTLPLGTQPVELTVVETGGHAVVSLGPGHAAAVKVPIGRAGDVVRFSVPGRPTALSFAGRIRAGVVTGTVRQGAALGKFTLVQRTVRPVNTVLGAYRLDNGGVLVLADYRRLGLPVWSIDYTSGAFHALRALGAAFDAGPAVLSTAPSVGRISVTGQRLTWAPRSAAPVSGTRLAVTQYEVRFPSGKAVLAGTLSIPAGPGRHAAVALVHGSGPALRDEGQFLTGLFLEHGIAVLAYDKRGNGESTGTYPGESATDSNIDVYARDADAALRFLSRQPDLDARHLGLFGGSQGGWIVPLAAARTKLVSFAIMQSGPTVTVGESDVFSGLTTQGAAPLSKPLAQIEAEVEQTGPSGFDPKPWIRRLQIPALWLYGGLDMNQPSHLDVAVLEKLETETGHDFTWKLYPDGNHGIFEIKSGLNSELKKSRGMPPAFFTDVAGWLRSHGLGSG